MTIINCYVRLPEGILDKWFWFCAEVGSNQTAIMTVAGVMLVGGPELGSTGDG